MAERIACLDFSKSPKDFRQIALEPGYPLLDRTNANARIVGKWLGRMVAEPERRGDVVSWFVRSEQGARLDGVLVCPITAKDLKGGLKHELKELEKRLDAVQPKTKAEQAIHKTIKDNLAQLVKQAHRPETDSYFLKYQDEQGKWRLLWMWGFERVEPTADSPALCIKPDCKSLFINNSAANGKCPHCKTALPIPPNPWKRLAIAMLVLLLLAGGGFGGWWYMQPRAAIKGVVLWSGNSQPVANATVSLPELDLTVQTDESGQFQFQRLPEGEAKVEISAVGYQSKSQTEALTVGQEASLKILVEGNATLTGKVINSVSKVPLDDVVIQVAGTEIQTHSDDDGLFQIEDLPGGKHAVHIQAAGFPEKDQDVELTAEQTADVTFALTGEGIVSGVILQANNEQPISGAKAELVGTGQSGETDGDGVFVIKQVPTGKGMLELSADGFSSQRKDLIVELKERPVRLLLLGAGILTGTITSKGDDKPIASATVQIDGTQHAARSDSSGRYSLPSIPAGPVKVVISAAGYRTAKFDIVVESGKQTLLDAKLEGGAVLAGVVIDGTTDKPVPNAEVLVSAFPNPLRTDDAGVFKVEGVKAGAAQITVNATGLKSQTVSKMLEEGQETKIEIKLIGDAKLRGTITDGLTGKPVANAEVQILETLLSGKTNADGQFEVDGLRSGPTKAEVLAKGYPSASFSESVASGKVTEPKWNLNGNSVLMGTVLDLAKDAPVAGATATISGTQVSVKSDDKGQFRLEKLPALPVMLSITATGYNPQTVEQDISSDKPAEIKVLLGGDAILVGEVYDTLTKLPIPNAKVGIVGNTLATRTDAKGQFRLENAFRGENEVAISSNDYPSQTQKVQLESQKEVNVRVGLSGDSVAKGTVLSEDGDPIAGATVKLPGTEHQTTTNDTGAFELDKLPGGPVSLEVAAKHYKTQTLTGNLVTSKPTTLLAAKLKSGLAITGLAISALNAQGMPGVKLKIDGTEITGTSDDAGAFQLDSVPIRPFTVKVEAENFYPESLEVDPINGSREIKPVLAPVLKPGETRVVLLWGEQIKDLDLHLYGPEGHIWHKNPKSATAQLDVDNRNGFGPETLTLKTPKAGRYEIVVHAYQDPKAEGALKINQSKAEVRIYQAGEKAGQHIHVSEDKDAEYPVWYVGAVEVSSAGAVRINPYGRLNYKAELPKD